MGQNVRSWTKAALGHSLTVQQFRANHLAQDKTADYVIGGYLKKYGTLEDVGSMWITGKRYDVAIIENKQDALGTTAEKYAAKLKGYYDTTPIPPGSIPDAQPFAVADATQQAATTHLPLPRARPNNSRGDIRSAMAAQLPGSVAILAAGHFDSTAQLPKNVKNATEVASTAPSDSFEDRWNAVPVKKFGNVPSPNNVVEQRPAAKARTSQLLVNNFS